MSTETPRTDINCLTVETLRTMKGTGTQIVLAAVCRQLERELAAANTRIERLEEAGGAMCRQLKDDRDDYISWEERSEQAIEAWRKAKQ